MVDEASPVREHWHSKCSSAKARRPAWSRGGVITEATVPTYQYACTACGHELEAVQSFTDSPLTECPACAGRLRKLFSAVGIVFKGSGFYRTDSRVNGASHESNGAAQEAAGGGAKGEAKSSDNAGKAGSAVGEGHAAASPSNGGSARSSAGTAAKPADTSPAKAASAAS
jgi:putative FmdB family regulatory protein